MFPFLALYELACGITDISFRAGELTEDELENIRAVIKCPSQFDIPNWFLNRQKDIKTGKFSHLIANQVDSKLREDLERMKKIRSAAFLPLHALPILLLSSIFSALGVRAVHPHACVFADCTVVSVTTGTSVSAASTPRPQAVAAELSVLPRRKALKLFALLLREQIKNGHPNPVSLVVVGEKQECVHSSGWCVVYCERQGGQSLRVSVYPFCVSRLL